MEKVWNGIFKDTILGFLFIASFTFNPINCFTISEQRIDELSNWFASGMKEYEKDYEKKAARHKNVDLNSYTQSEANIKLLADTYNVKMKSKNINSFLLKNPPPNITTPQDFRQNEDNIILWVLKLYENNLIKKPLEHFLPLVKQILNKERTNASDSVFYHAYQSEFGLVFDIYREIENFLLHAAQIFNSEKHETNMSSKVHFRDISTLKFPYKNINNFINYWEEYFLRKKSNKWDDSGEKELKDNVLSVNLSLFGNAYRSDENSFDFFVNSKSMAASPQGLLDNLFYKWNFNIKYKQELITLYNNFMKTESGHLTQIFIPLNLVDQYAYASHDWGTPLRFKITDSFNEKNISGFNLSRHTDIKSIIEFYKKPNSYLLHNLLDQLQARIVLMPSFFDPENNIRIIRYTTSGIEKEFGNDYKKALRQIIGKMILSYIITNQQIIINGNDTSLKMILYTISEWAANFSHGEKEQHEKEKEKLTAQLETKEKLNFPPSRHLKLFIESNDPLEYSYEGLIQEYNNEFSINSRFAPKLLETLNEIAYTKEGYANKYDFIKKYLDKEGFSAKEIYEKLGG
ncbi:MAG: hypothetical protein P4L22_01310 [Candidatus Babeliales bacterium]|nr:hypothetical protein [Candidatus Babeliales bacterium]